MSRPRRLIIALALMSFGLALAAPGAAAPLAAVRARGSFNVCAHPDGLPYSSQDRTWPGFQLEIGEAIARRLGVKLHVDWIVYTRHARRLDCDAIMGSIVKLEPGEPGGRPGQRLSKPYTGSGYVLVLPPGTAAVTRVEDVRGGKIGVEHSSWPHYILDTRKVPLSSFRSSLDVLDAVASGEVVAGLVPDAYAGWYIKLNPGRLRIAEGLAPEPDFQWNVAIGLRGADAALQDAVNEALDALVANGTIATVLGKYGIKYRPPIVP
jgi:polar amino acid transport system substrate-binding protein